MFKKKEKKNLPNFNADFPTFLFLINGENEYEKRIVNNEFKKQLLFKASKFVLIFYIHIYIFTDN